MISLSLSLCVWVCLFESPVPIKVKENHFRFYPKLYFCRSMNKRKRFINFNSIVSWYFFLLSSIEYLLQPHNISMFALKNPIISCFAYRVIIDVYYEFDTFKICKRCVSITVFFPPLFVCFFCVSLNQIVYLFFYHRQRATNFCFVWAPNLYKMDQL